MPEPTLEPRVLPPEPAGADGELDAGAVAVVWVVVALAWSCAGGVTGWEVMALVVVVAGAGVTARAGAVLVDAAVVVAEAVTEGVVAVITGALAACARAPTAGG